MSKEKAIQSAQAKLTKARKLIEDAETILGPFEGLSDELSMADRSIEETLEVLQEELDA